MLLLILGFAAGIYVGYKYPEQVDKAAQWGKTTFTDLKDKISKKETPPQS